MTQTTVVIISDTHGFTERAEAFINRISPDAVFHLGDHAKDAHAISLAFPSIPFYVLKGNCDGYFLEKEELLFSIKGHTIFAAHGHKQKVKQDMYGIYFAALDNEADVAIYGHTHFPCITEKDGILLVNPGTAGSGPRLTAAVLYISNERCKAEIFEI